MSEFTNVAAQTVAANGNVVFSNIAVKGSNCIQHREGSGIITLRGLTNLTSARLDFSWTSLAISQFQQAVLSELFLWLLRSLANLYYLHR